MTGFGQAEKTDELLKVTTEIKSVNNRFKDYKFRMSYSLNPLELELRSLLDQEFKRGSFDVSISLKKENLKGREFNLDQTKIEEFLKFIRSINELKNVNLQVNPTDFLRSDFSLEEDPEKLEKIKPLVLESVKKAIEGLKISREQEGSRLVEKLKEHLHDYRVRLDEVSRLKHLYPQILKDKLESKLNEKLKDFKLDDSRLMQEIVYYLEKLEVDEEINRAKIHLIKFDQILNSAGEVGRQIDFLLQELGRETNTLGSKSAHPEISSHVVEMKVQLEKIREQALNLE